MSNLIHPTIREIKAIILKTGEQVIGCAFHDDDVHVPQELKGKLITLDEANDLLVAASLKRRSEDREFPQQEGDFTQNDLDKDGGESDLCFQVWTESYVFQSHVEYPSDLGTILKWIKSDRNPPSR